MRVEKAQHAARLLLAGLLAAAICAAGSYAQSRDSGGEQGATGEPYPQMPAIAPIGVRTGKYMDAPPSAQGPAIDPARGYRLQDLGGRPGSQASTFTSGISATRWSRACASSRHRDAAGRRGLECQKGLTLIADAFLRPRP